MAFIQDNITFNKLSKIGIGSPFGNVVKDGITSEEDLKVFVDAFKETGEADYDYRNIQSVLIDWNGAQLGDKTLNTTGEVLSVLKTAYDYATTYTGKTTLSSSTKLGTINGKSLTYGGSIDIEVGTGVTESTVYGWGFTKNAGTITGITMNGASKGTSGVVDLGTVLTQHQDLSGMADKDHIHSMDQIIGLSDALNKITTDIQLLSDRIAALEKHHENVLVTGISLSQTSATLTGKNATLTLTPTITPNNATNKSVIWASNNENVAKVVGGVVTPLKAGTATITATTTDGSSKSASCVVTVKEGTTTWKLEPLNASINEGEQKTFSMSVVESNTFVTPDASGSTWNVQYKTNNNTYEFANNILNTTVGSRVVATGPSIISSSAVTYYINVNTADSTTKTATLSVSQSVIPVTSVTLDKTSYNLNGTTSGTITATVLPANATNKSITWNVSSSNNAINYTANDNKLTITGRAVGTATIIATADGKSSTSCTVTVKQGTISITGINPSTSEIQEGSSKELTVTYSSTLFAGAPHNFTWSCSGNESNNSLLSSTTGTSITFNAPDYLGADVSGSSMTYYINVTSTQASSTASATVTVKRKAQETEYYWYAGQTKPTSMTSNPTPDDTNFTNNKWHTLSKDATSISKTITSGTSGNAWYIAVPTSFGLKPTATDLATPNNTWTTEGTIIINNVEYTLWKPSGTSSRQAVYMAKI